MLPRLREGLRIDAPTDLQRCGFDLRCGENARAAAVIGQCTYHAACRDRDRARRAFLAAPRQRHPRWRRIAGRARPSGSPSRGADRPACRTHRWRGSPPRRDNRGWRCRFRPARCRAARDARRASRRIGSGHRIIDLADRDAYLGRPASECAGADAGEGGRIVLSGAIVRGVAARSGKDVAGERLLGVSGLQRSRSGLRERRGAAG